MASFKATSDLLVMSVLNPARESCTCAYCDEQRDPQASVAGSYCSSKCHEAHQRERAANDLLNKLRYDHRFCFTCFRQLKEVAEPPARAPACAIGLQYLTEHADIGEKSRLRFETNRPDGPSPDRVRTGTVCACGSTEHSDCIELFRRLEPKYVVRFATAVNTLVAEGKIEADAIDQEAFVDALPADQLRDAVEAAVTIDVDE